MKSIIEVMGGQVFSQRASSALGIGALPTAVGRSCARQDYESRAGLFRTAVDGGDAVEAIMKEEWPKP